MGPQEKADYEHCLNALPALLQSLPRRLADVEAYRRHQMGQGLMAMFGLSARRPAAADPAGGLAPVALGDVKSFYTGMRRPDGKAIDTVSERFCSLLMRRPEWLDFARRCATLGVTPTAYIAQETEKSPIHGTVKASMVYVRLDQHVVEPVTAPVITPPRRPSAHDAPFGK